MKSGDIVRIVKCCYPTPNHHLLGKCSIIDDVDGDIVKLKRWDIKLNIYFLEKVSIFEDINIKLDENSIVNIQ